MSFHFYGDYPSRNGGYYYYAAVTGALKHLRRSLGVSAMSMQQASSYPRQVYQSRISQSTENENGEPQRYEIARYLHALADAVFDDGHGKQKPKTPFDQALEWIGRKWKADDYHDGNMRCTMELFEGLDFEFETNGTNGTCVKYRRLQNDFTEGKEFGRPDLSVGKLKVEVCRTKDLESNRKRLQRESYGQRKDPTVLTDGRIYQFFKAGESEPDWVLDVLSLKPQDRRYLENLRTVLFAEAVK